MAENPTRRGSNLTQADRERGGRESARKQVRDQRGQFAGSRDKKEKSPKPQAPHPPQVGQGDQEQSEVNEPQANRTDRHTHFSEDQAEEE